MWIKCCPQVRFYVHCTTACVMMRNLWLAARPKMHLFQIGCTTIPICLSTAVQLVTYGRVLPLSASHHLQVPIVSLSTGIPSFQLQHIERASAPCHIHTVTHSFRTASSQDFPVFSLLSGHTYVTYLSFLSASLYFSKRGAYWDRLCRDVVGRWLVGCHACALWPNGAS